MKQLTPFRLVTFLFFSLFSLSAIAQSPCDQCNDPWGPVEKIVITGQTISSKQSSCTYTYVIEYRERNCGGELEVEIISMNIQGETNNPFCNLTPGDCYNSRRAGIRSLVNMFGVPVTFSQEKSCYVLFEVDPPQEFIDCFLSPGEAVPQWTSFMDCDASSCCSVTYTPVPGGGVSYRQNASLPCTSGSIPELPEYIEWECQGEIFIVMVDQGQAVQCEYTCPSGGGFFKSAEVDEIPTENEFTLYPNPTNGMITLDYTVFENNQLEILVFNVKGQEVYRQVVETTNGSSSLTLNTEEWGAGIYTMRIQGNDELLNSQRIQVLK